MKSKKSIISENCGEKKEKSEEKSEIYNSINLFQKLKVGCYNCTAYAFFVTKCLP